MGQVLTYFEVVLVRKGVVYSLNFGYGIQNLLTHLVQGILDAWATFLCEGFKGNGSSRLPRLVKFGNCGMYVLNTAERIPGPTAVDLGA